MKVLIKLIALTALAAAGAQADFIIACGSSSPTVTTSPTNTARALWSSIMRGKGLWYPLAAQMVSLGHHPRGQNTLYLDNWNLYQYRQYILFDYNEIVMNNLVHDEAFECKVRLDVAIAALAMSSEHLKKVILCGSDEAIESGRFSLRLARMRFLEARSDCREMCPDQLTC